MARAPSGLFGPPAMKVGKSGRRRSISSGGRQSGHSRFCVMEFRCHRDRVRRAHSRHLLNYRPIWPEELLFSEFSLPDLEPRLLSFNSPACACPTFEGLGVSQFFDPLRLVAADVSTAARDPFSR